MEAISEERHVSALGKGHGAEVGPVTPKRVRSMRKSERLINSLQLNMGVRLANELFSSDFGNVTFTNARCLSGVLPLFLLGFP